MDDCFSGSYSMIVVAIAWYSTARHFAFANSAKHSWYLFFGLLLHMQIFLDRDPMDMENSKLLQYIIAKKSYLTNCQFENSSIYQTFPLSFWIQSLMTMAMIINISSSLLQKDAQISIAVIPRLWLSALAIQKIIAAAPIM